MNKIAMLTLAGCAMLANGLCAATYKYDFSAVDAPVQDGFTQITKKDSDACKWIPGAEALEAHFTKFNYASKKDSQGRNIPPANYMINLSASHIQGMYKANFTLPQVAPGKYHVWALCGLGSAPSYTVWDISLKAGTGTGKLTFQKFSEIMEMDFETEVGNGGLPVQITSRGHWVLNAMVLIPQDKWIEERDGWLKELREEIFILPKPVRDTWTHAPVECTLPEPKWNDKQKKDGFAVFTRNWATPVWPDHYPEQKEIDAPVRAFASLGEHETLNFALFPFKNFEKVTLEVSDLQGPIKNLTIPSTAFDLRYVKYMWVRPNYNIHGMYMKAPDVLMPMDKPIRMVKGENLRFWLTVHVPLDTPAGIYKGTAIVKADAVTVNVPLTLRVLPIRLTRDESLTFGQYYYSPDDEFSRTDDAFSREWIQKRTEAEHNYMREFGHSNYNVTLRLINRNGKFYPNVEEFQQRMDTAIKFGFTRPLPCSFGVGTIYAKYKKGGMGSHLSTVEIPPQEFFDEITEVVSRIQKEAVRRQWPELLYYPVDEPSTTKTSVEFMTKIMMAIKRVPGARTYITGEPAHPQFAPLLPYVDVWCGQAFCFPREKILKDMAERPGLEYWAYPNHISGENNHTVTLGARMTYGFGLWQSGYRCLIPWIYGSSTGSQWNYLDSRTSDFDNRVDMDGSPIPVTLWYAYREGMDDGKYLNTLEKLISRARDYGYNAQADAAQKDIDLIRSAINVQTKYKNTGLWNADSFDAYRWLLATRIMELNQLF